MTHARRLLAGLLLALPALADEHAGVRFTPPKGWEGVDSGEARVLVAPGQSEDEALVVLLAPAEPATASSPEEELADVAARLNAGAEVNGRGPVTSADLGARGALRMQRMQVTDGDIGQHMRMVVVLIAGGKRAVALVIWKPDEVLARHEAALTALLDSLELVGAAPAKPAGAPAPQAGAGKLPTGDTPDLFPGSPGWLPSGRGVAIPTARLVDGRPEGIWWRLAPQNTRMTVRDFIYLPDGTRASNPRPGGPDLFDLEGQRRQKGTTGVGTWRLAGDRWVEAWDDFTSEGTFQHGSDADGPFFKVGEALYRPLARPTREGVIGAWTTPGGRWVFKADGTYESGHITETGDFTLAAGGRGTWELDGWLIAIRPAGAPMWINKVGAWNQRHLMLGATLYEKE